MAVQIPKVVLADNENKPIDIEKQVLGEISANLVYLNTTDIGPIVEAARDADALMCTYAPISPPVIAELKRCRVIVRYGIGVDNIDVDAASKAGIWVANLPDYAILEVANHTMAFIMALNRKLVVYNAAIRKGQWGFKTGAPIERLDDQILGLVGFGNIAQSVAQKARGVGLKVIAYDPFIEPARMTEKGVEHVATLDDLLKRSDFVSLHAPMNQKTRNLIDERALRLMKRSAYLVNTGRGGLIDEPVLITALREKWISGAGLDVYREEPIRPDNELLSLDNVVLTPHAAYYSEASQRSQQKMAAEAVVDVLKGGKPKSLFNKQLLTQYGKL